LLGSVFRPGMHCQYESLEVLDAPLAAVPKLLSNRDACGWSWQFSGSLPTVRHRKGEFRQVRNATAFRKLIEEGGGDVDEAPSVESILSADLHRDVHPHRAADDHVHVGLPQRRKPGH
jgi:hypothetical protein